MATISEDYVSFETAKLLKEKGFDYQGFDYIDFEGEVIRQDRPTHQMAMKWLREEHGLFIHIGNDDLDYWWQIEDVLNKDDNYDPICKSESYGGNKTYEEAVEAAIKYCLENLI